jgi:hypothetical protein
MCDCEYPTVYGEKLRTARKDYICSSCYSDIPRKSKYFDIGGLWDGSWDNYKRCESCNEIANRLANETGECIPIEGLIIELQNCDLIENQGEEDDEPMWISNVDWLKIKSQNPLQVGLVYAPT